MLKRLAILAVLVTATVGASAQSAPPVYAPVPMNWQYTQSTDLAVGFMVYRATGAGSGSYVKISGLIPAAQLDYVDESALEGVTYTYYVVAVDAIGNRSAPSNLWTTTASNPGGLNQPTNLSGTP